MNTVKALHGDAHPLDRLTPLLAGFAAAAAEHDASESFVSANYALLKEARLMSAAVPEDLGGDGLEVPALARLLTTLARACPSTALAFAMHTHSVAVLAWRWRKQKAPVDALLRRIADEQIVIATSGGSDWLDGSGRARRVEGGYAIEAVKGFASGSPAAALMNTTAVFDDPESGPTVIHFMLPLNAKEVRIEDAWRAMGMRATASNLVHIGGFFVPEDKVALKRPKGKWHPLYHIISMLAFALIYSVYLGVAEAMRDAAVATARRRPMTPQLVDLAGEVETDLAAARYAVADMIAASAGVPGVETTNRVHLGRANFVSAAMRMAGNALELAAAGGYMRGHPVERLFRDIQAARFHPLTSRAQRDFAGRVALGLDVDGPVNASAA